MAARVFAHQANCLDQRVTALFNPFHGILQGSEVSVLSIQRPGSWKVSIPVSEANWSEEKFARLGINARVDSR